MVKLHPDGYSVIDLGEDMIPTVVFGGGERQTGAYLMVGDMPLYDPLWQHQIGDSWGRGDAVIPYKYRSSPLPDPY